MPLIGRFLTGSLLCATLAALLIGCSDSGDTGTLSVSLTDAPFPATEDCLDAALITIDEVSANTGETWTEIGLVDPDPDGTVTLDLLQLRAGLEDELAYGDLPAGEVSEVRLHVVESVLVFSDASPDVAFKIPSGDASGLKLKIRPPAFVAPDQTTELVFDVDLGNSFRTAGLGGDPTCDDLKMGSGKVLFGPVVRVNNLSTDGIVLGNVSDGGGMGVADVEVCAFDAGTDIVAEPDPVACTLSAPAGLPGVSEGDYALLVPAGSYDLYVRAQGVEDKTLAASGVNVGPGERVEGVDLTLP
jgi:hypothetical protein